MSDEAIGGWFVFGIIAALLVGGWYWFSGGSDINNVRNCLTTQSQQYGIARGHDAYLTDVVDVEAYKTYADNTATRFVKYRLQGSDEIHSTTCRW